MNIGLPISAHVFGAVGLPRRTENFSPRRARDTLAITGQLPAILKQATEP
jgi:hypothetical protein